MRGTQVRQAANFLEIEPLMKFMKNILAIELLVLICSCVWVCTANTCSAGDTVSLNGTDSDWPQWLGPRRDGVWRETGILEKFPVNGPAVRWRREISAGYSGPAVANGKVYVTDRVLAKGTTNPADPFKRGEIPGTERVLCLNEADGSVLWKHEYDCGYTVSYPSGPRATPIIHDKKLYTLGTEGNLFCLDAENGNVIWKHELKIDYGVESPLWGFSANPLLDGNKLICMVGGKDHTVVAFDKDTGKEIWKALSSQQVGYCPPMIYEAGGKRQLIICHAESINSLDPETGSVYWSQPFAAKMGLAIPTPRLMGDMLFFTNFYDGSMMLHLDPDKPAASVLWKGATHNENKTDMLHSIISTPFLEDGHIYGVCSYGQLRCLDASNGSRLWETYEATGGKNMRWANAFIIKNGDRFFLANEQGDLIIAKLSPKGYEEISRAHLLEPTSSAMGRNVVWSHPAFANHCVYARNDKEIICVSLAK